jgi:F420-0:gamma-glutamyl ligase
MLAMKITAYKTDLITPGDSIEELIIKNIKQLPENSILTIVSKAFSFSENRLVPKVTGTTEEMHKLAKQEADFYLDSSLSRYNLLLTIKGNWMFVNSGVDQSNSENQYTLWPKNPQESVNKIWKFLRLHYGLKNVGVIMTDSKSFPLSWGVVGHGIAYAGFNPLKDYRGSKDLHGREMEMEKLSIVQSIATAACLEMGEGNEQRPIAVVNELQQDIEWLDHVPTQDELDDLSISIEDDLFAPMLTSLDWEKGGDTK